MEEKLTKSNNIEIKLLSDKTRNFEKSNGYLQQHLSAIIVSLLPCMFGTVLGWSAPSLTSLLSETASPLGQALSAKEASLVGSLIFAGGILGTLIWSRIADHFGRKVAGYIIGLNYLIGWTIIYFINNKFALLFARFVLGISCTGSLILCPLYISEIADDNIRGTLGSYAILFMNLGTLSSYCFGAIFLYKMLTLTCLVLPVIFLLLFTWLPETPTFLWKIGERNQAESSLLWLRGDNLNKTQQEIIKFSTIDINKNNNVTYKELLSTKVNRMGMFIGLGLFAGQQLCGILALLTYVTVIFQESGSSLNADMSTILVGIFQLIASGFSTLLVEKTGRKLLLLISFLSMGLSLTLLGAYFYIKENTSLNLSCFEWLPVLLLSIHVMSYSLGVGPIPYVVMTETLSPHIRALAASAIIFWGTALTFMCVLIFPYLIIKIGSHGCFWFFAFFCYLGFVFTCSVVPETKGKPLADILAKFTGDV